jgi:hypothetical protein
MMSNEQKSSPSLKERIPTCSQESYRQLDRLLYVNPLVVEDSTRAVIDSARRLLEYERFLDRLEHLKAQQGSLPKRVEERLRQSVTQAYFDAREMARATLELFNEFQDTGVLEQLVPAMAGCLSQVGEIRSDEALAEVLPFAEQFAADRGLPSELWQWVLQYVHLDSFTLSSSGDKILVSGADHITMLAGSIPTNLTTIDSNAFIDAQLYRQYSPSQKAMVDGVPNNSLYGSLINQIKTLLQAYERRAQTTALHGLQVLPTGVIPVIIFVVFLILAVAALVITILCAAGVIKSDVGCFAAFLGTILFSQAACRTAPKDPDYEVDCLGPEFGGDVYG